MRRLSTVPTILTLLFASIMAPYQHVHVHLSQKGGLNHHDHDDDEAPVVHIHLYAFSIPGGPARGTNVEDTHSGHVAIALDTFATISYIVVPTLAKPQSHMLLFPSKETIAEIVRVIEPRGHDPPVLDFSSPRAPPV